MLTTSMLRVRKQDGAPLAAGAGSALEDLMVTEAMMAADAEMAWVSVGKP